MSLSGTQHSQQHLWIIFIQNIPKRINYMMNYLDSHLCRLLVDLVGDGQSNLIMQSIN